MTNLFLITAIHLAALGQIESGDNDAALGAAGELSRFQFLPKVAAREVGENPSLRGQTFSGHWERDVTITREIARGVWSKRVATFELVYRRQPTLAELYLCWHRPGRVLNPTKREMALAIRFQNVAEELTAEAARQHRPTLKTVLHEVRAGLIN